jgi:hypothetical protein
LKAKIFRFASFFSFFPSRSAHFPLKLEKFLLSSHFRLEYLANHFLMLSPLQGDFLFLLLCNEKVRVKILPVPDKLGFATVNKLRETMRLRQDTETPSGFLSRLASLRSHESFRSRSPTQLRLPSHCSTFVIKLNLFCGDTMTRSGELEVAAVVNSSSSARLYQVDSMRNCDIIADNPLVIVIIFLSLMSRAGAFHA